MSPGKGNSFGSLAEKEVPKPLHFPSVFRDLTVDVEEPFDDFLLIFYVKDQSITLQYEPIKRQRLELTTGAHEHPLLRHFCGQELVHFVGLGEI